MMHTTPTTEHDDGPVEYPDDDECLEAGNPDDRCRGPVEMRCSLNRGASFPRCAYHWEERLEREDHINRRYPQLPPADWSPDDAGEHWADDY